MRGFRILKSDIEIAPVHDGLPDRIHRHHARIADRKLEGITTPSPEQLELFSTLNLPKPA
ncbi:MAG: hypothetical protein K9G72_20145 [Rhodobacteraceae bacterium]|nr:hypothetical protein [Paracoccaceae bacterium]